VLWDDIYAEQPDLFIWLGDNVYGDTEDMEILRSYYHQQKANREYQAMRVAFPIIGIWDDHDYGENDAGKEYPMKDETQQLALDFLDVADSSIVRKQAGLYQSYDMGAEGQVVRFLLLDTRYHRDPLTKSNLDGQRYQLNETGDILGEAQWKWLHQQLTNSPAQVHIIATSIQFLANDHGYEKWGNFPSARQRMMELLEELQVANPVFISGDRHIAELSKVKLDQLTSPIYDLTSSGLTHTWSEPEEEPNTLRISDLIFQLNYGVIEFDWAGQELTLRIRGEEKTEYLTHTLPLQ